MIADNSSQDMMEAKTSTQPALQVSPPRWHAVSRAMKLVLRERLPRRVVSYLAKIWGANPRRLLSLMGSCRRESRIRRAIVFDAPMVHSGPFRGMWYLTTSAGSAYWPKILGTYETVLHEAIEQLIRSAPRLVIDLGCAEGYYAVGIAMRARTARIIASDIDPIAQQQCLDLAELNDVADRVAVVAELTAGELNNLIEDGCWVIVDVEGAEVHILRPDEAPRLRFASLIVEVHDFIDPAISELLSARFSSTHRIDVIDDVEPNWHFVEAVVRRLSPGDREHALSEYRPSGMQWMILTPLTVDEFS